jgi:hypothetical protein
MLNELFYCTNKDTYPPFKRGQYMEEYFLDFMKDKEQLCKRKYIPALWTNFQISPWFKSRQAEMQQSLDMWLQVNPSPDGYFTVVQYDDGPLLQLPKNTLKMGACSGDVPVPLIYDSVLMDLNPIRTYHKPILCSFTGSNTHPLRATMTSKLNGVHGFDIRIFQGWSAVVDNNKQKLFMELTANSKFTLAPRGYGRSSFRLFETFMLGSIPVYVWDDINWLPFQDSIDYKQLCITINIKDIDHLPEILNSVTEQQYMKMWAYYDRIRHLFTIEGMSWQIINEVNKPMPLQGDRIVQYAKLVSQSSFYPNIILSDHTNTAFRPMIEYSQSLGTPNWRYRNDTVQNIQRKGKYFYFIYDMENYYHFIYDSLPYLMAYLELKKQIPSLQLLMQFPPGKDRQYAFVSEMLDILEIPQHDIVMFDALSEYEELYITKSVTFDALSMPDSVKKFYSDIVQKCTQDTQNCHEPATPQHIYVSRRLINKDDSNMGTNYTQKRVMVNEQELVQKLSLFNPKYTEVFTETLSMREKIRLFAKAKSVIGAIGGGLVNAVFCSASTKLIVIVSPTFLDINGRFSHCLDGHNTRYFYGTMHSEKTRWTTYTRIRYKGGLGEIQNIDGGQLHIQWSSDSVSGFNQQMQYQEIIVNEDDKHTYRLDNGLNSPWKLHLDRFMLFLRTGQDVVFSLCIPTMDRFDQFLQHYIPKYLNNQFIDEIVITDENGNDAKKIFHMNYGFKVKIFTNSHRLGPFLNKLQCCRLARNNWIMLMDSDNFAPDSYTLQMAEYIHRINPGNNSILSPDFARPSFNYKEFSGKIICSENINNFHGSLECMMNTGNYVINKYLIDTINLKGEEDTISKCHACDVIYFNTLLFEQLNLHFHVVPDAEYDHVVHNGSIYMQMSGHTRITINQVHNRFRTLTTRLLI